MTVGAADNVNSPREDRAKLRGLGWLWTIAISVVLTGAWMVAPGIGVLMTLVMAVTLLPVTIHSRVQARRAQASSQSSSASSFADYAASFLITAASVAVGIFVSWIVGTVAFLAICFAAVASLRFYSPNTERLFAISIFLASAISIAGGLITATAMLRLSWPKIGKK